MTIGNDTLPRGLYKRGNTWCIRIQRNGERVSKSLKCVDLASALGQYDFIVSSLEMGIPSSMTWGENKRGGDWIKKIISSSRKRSEDRGIEFEIDYEYISKLANSAGMRCAITGIHFNWWKPSHSRVGPYVPSLDRIDSKKGYIPGNVRLVCWAANIGMSDWGAGVFFRICNMVTANQLLAGNTEFASHQRHNSERK
jgi:hypothetical protein